MQNTQKETNTDFLERLIILEHYKNLQRRFEAGVTNNDCLEKLMILAHCKKFQGRFGDLFYKFNERISRSGNGGLRETLLGVQIGGNHSERGPGCREDVAIPPRRVL